MNTGFWSRFRVTFGPALAGLLGGGLTLGVAWAATSGLFTNIANTYAKYPSLQPPWLAHDFTLPSIVLIPLVILGTVAPFGMGLTTAWLVRSKDRWGDISAGLTTALTSSLAAYVACIGWTVMLATVIVPSIADLTLLGNSSKGTGGHPSDVLTEQYPDLKAAPADERGALFFPKIVSDQAVGTVNGAWMGVALSLATVGVLGFAGTLVGGWLLRRGGSCRSILVPYAELTVSTSLGSGRLLSSLLGVGPPVSALEAVCLVAATSLVCAGVVSRWHWLLRVTLAVSWILVMSGAGFNNHAYWAIAPFAAYLAYGVSIFLLARHLYLRERTPSLAAA